jgi:hypothetical protein
MGIAEVRYNNDKIMSLIVKLYRPIPDDMEKKHTINVYVSGKVNFDGGNSELEVMHIYYWLEYIFQKYESALLIHVDAIHHFVPQDDDNTDSESIYDDEIIYTDPTSDIYTKRVAAVVTRT